MVIEQRGGKKDCYGCKDKVMINNAILENCRKRKKNLSTAWIDYKEVFDSVPYSWIIKCMTLYKVHLMITNFIKSSMTRWKTNMTPGHNRSSRNSTNQHKVRNITGRVPIPLLFTMSLNPFSRKLQKTGYGYQLDEQTKTNHLFYVDDLRLYETNDN